MATAVPLILVTGATGFVGQQVLRALAERGARVRAVVRVGKQDQFANQRGIETVVTTADLFAENNAWWAVVCKCVDTVIHVAWYAEPGKYLQSAKNLDCLIGTLQMAKGAAQAKVKRLIGIGTCSGACYLLLMPWNIAVEVKQQNAQLAELGTKFVTAVPRLEMI